MEEADIHEAPLVWNDWVQRFHTSLSGVYSPSVYVALIVEGLRMVSTCPWSCSMPLLRLVICESVETPRPCMSVLPKDSASFLQLREILRDFMLAPGLEKVGEACFVWVESRARHWAGIDDMGKPELGLVLWSYLSMDCVEADQFPTVEWVVQAFNASCATSLMIPTVWVAINLLARMKALAGVPVPLQVLSHLMEKKTTRMHYSDLSAMGEALLIKWLDAEQRGECPHAGKLRFSKDSRWTRSDIKPRLIARAKGLSI